MEVTTTETKKKSGLLNPKALVIASIGCLVLAILARFIPALIQFISVYLYSSYYGRFYALSNYITSSISTVFIGLLLPVSLLLLNKHPEKARLSKLFMLIGALFIVIQILGVFLQFVTLLLLENTGYGSVLYDFASVLELLFNMIPGNQLLASPFSFLFMLTYGYWSAADLIVSLLSVIFTCAAELLLLLSNALVTVGFFCAKKDATVEEIAEAPVEA